VSALRGLNATLPISLIQMSLRRSASTGAFNPPAIIASLNALQRAEISPDGSPIENRVPLDVSDHSGCLDCGGRIHHTTDGPLP